MTANVQWHKSCNLILNYSHGAINMKCLILNTGKYGLQVERIGRMWYPESVSTKYDYGKTGRTELRVVWPSVAVAVSWLKGNGSWALIRNIILQAIHHLIIPRCDLSTGVFQFHHSVTQSWQIFLSGITSTVKTQSVISSPGWMSSAAKGQRCLHNFPQFALWTAMIVIFQNYHLSEPRRCSIEERVTVYVCCQTGPATLVA